MTEKELKKLNRKQLLEMLLIQTKRADELESRLEEAQKALNDREITLSKAGSIAEAALRLNGIFEAADLAAKQYLDNIKRLESALAARATVSGIDESEIPPTPAAEPFTEPNTEPEETPNEEVSSEEVSEDIPESISEIISEQSERSERSEHNGDISETVFLKPEQISEIKVQTPRGDKKCKTKKIIITKATAISTQTKNIPPVPKNQKPKA